MHTEILNVTERAVFDSAIVNADKHTHQPYANSTYKNNDVIRIPIENEDVYTLPWDSIIYIEGRLLKKDKTPSASAKLINNGVMHLFEEIRYEIGGKVIDRVRNPGITTTMKGYISYNSNESRRLQNAGWLPPKLSDQSNAVLNDVSITNKDGYFNVCIPLRMVMGFGEDFRKILLNVKQELILIRSSTDTNAIINTTKDEDASLILDQISWKIPHISVADAERLKLLRYLQKSMTMEIAFRSWELHEYPLLNKSQSHMWAIKAVSQLEKPRFIILGFQTSRNNDETKNKSVFDHCNLRDVKLHLGSTMYPYDNLHVDFKKNRFAILYEMYAQFQHSYYGSVSEPLFTPEEFLNIAPLIVIDCSHQNETVKTGAIDVRLEFETTENIPDKTAAYCLILHDRIVRYNPTTNIVHQV